MCNTNDSDRASLLSNEKNSRAHKSFQKVLVHWYNIGIHVGLRALSLYQYLYQYSFCTGTSGSVSSFTTLSRIRVAFCNGNWPLDFDLCFATRILAASRR